jgi:hypothetical protein
MKLRLRRTDLLCCCCLGETIPVSPNILDINLGLAHLGWKKATVERSQGALLLKPVRWSPHARLMLPKREVEQAEADQTLMNPDDIKPAETSRMIHQRVYFDKVLGQKMLLRLVVEETEDERVVVTVYKTSRLDKYRR